MERKDFGYSLKNIPIAGQEVYLKCVYEKTEKFIRMMRWKAMFSEQPAGDIPEMNTYGFGTCKTPPVMDLLKAFEEDLYNLVGSIQFTSHRNAFQQQLNRDVWTAIDT